MGWGQQRGSGAVARRSVVKDERLKASRIVGRGLFWAMRIYWASSSHWMRTVLDVGGLAICGNQADLYLPCWTFITFLDGKLLPLFSIHCCLAKRWIFGVEVAVLCL